MEKIIKTISKGDRVPVMLKPNEREEFSVRNGIDYYFDILQLNYNKKYAGYNITVSYVDANGNENSFAVILDDSGFMSWMNTEPIENPLFGGIAFACRQEIGFEFTIKVSEGEFNDH